MSAQKSIEDVRRALQKFANGYKERNLENLEEFLFLFIQNSNVELIGIGASERGGVEWFEGIDQVREIIQSDWEYWGDVAFDVTGAKINVNGDVAWLTTTGTLEQTDTFDKALPIYLEQMKKIISEDNKTADEKLIEASHYGVRRLRERLKGAGYQWPFVLSAILQKEEDQWAFHTIHWSMPVD